MKFIITIEIVKRFLMTVIIVMMTMVKEMTALKITQQKVYLKVHVNILP